MYNTIISYIVNRSDKAELLRFLLWDLLPFIHHEKDLNTWMIEHRVKHYIIICLYNLNYYSKSSFVLCIGSQLKAVNVSKVHGVDNNIQQTKLASPLFLYFPFHRCLLDSDFYLKYFPSKTNTRCYQSSN